MRIGLGEDSHRTAPGGPLRLGGIEVPHDRGLVGHSDADVLLHAVTDALLGAAALSDIGRLFPNTDPANRGRDSAEMLAIAARQVADRNFRYSAPELFEKQPGPRCDQYSLALIYHELLTGTLPAPAGRGRAPELGLLPEADRSAQKPGLMMANIYRTLLREIEAGGFQVLHQRISLTPLRKLWIALRTHWRGR